MYALVYTSSHIRFRAMPNAGWLGEIQREEPLDAEGLSLAHGATRSLEVLSWQHRVFLIHNFLTPGAISAAFAACLAQGRTTCAHVLLDCRY